MNFRGAELTAQLNIQAPMGGIVPDKADKTRFNRFITLIRQVCSFGRVNKKPPAEPRAKYQEQLSQPFDLAQGRQRNA